MGRSGKETLVIFSAGLYYSSFALPCLPKGGHEHLRRCVYGCHIQYLLHNELGILYHNLGTKAEA